MKSKAVLKVMTPRGTGCSSVADLMKQVLRELGEDPSREGLTRTPERADRALRFLTSGYSTYLKTLLNGALFTVKYDEMVIVKDI